MNILVTGSNGFIGGHVCAWLKEKGCHVIGLGRRETSRIDVDEYICCDLSSSQMEDIFCGLTVQTVDAVVHLAADMRHEPYASGVVAHNCVGTQRLLEFCEAKHIPTFVQLSSLPVIGKPVMHPITESHPIMPPTVYHVTKRTQELLADYAWYTFGLRTVSFRICAPVGIGMNPKTIFPVFVTQAVHGKELVLVGKGTRRQTYIHVTDIARAIYLAIHSNAQGIYNLASHNLISNYELAQKCVNLTGSKSKITFSSKADPMDDFLWDVSTEKAKHDMGYEPIVPIEVAIAEYASEIIKQ